MHVRDDEQSGNVYSETYECRVKGYAIADMALLCHFADEETEAPDRGSGGPVSHIV